MNKGNKILLGVLAFVVACVVGYALFSESITISGSASASGDFRITTTCSAGVNSKIFEAFADYGITEKDFVQGGYANESCNVSGNKVSLAVDLKYPTAQRAFTISFKNTGSMDAVVIANGNTPVENTNIVVYDNTGAVYKTLAQGDSEFSNYLNQFGKFSSSTLGVIVTSTGESIHEASDKWQSRILDKPNKTNENEYYLKLEPNDTLMLLVWANWDNDATLKNYSAKTTAIAEQKFQQITTDMFENADGFTCFSGC